MRESSSQVVHLAFYALDHALTELFDAGSMTPFAVLEDEEGRRSLLRFPGDRAQGQAARGAVVRAGETGQAVRGAVSWDGYLDEAGRRTRAVFVEVSEEGDPESLVLAQRYEPEVSRKSAAKSVGTPALIRRRSLFH